MASSSLCSIKQLAVTELTSQRCVSNLFIEAPNDGDSKAPQATWSSASLSALVFNSSIWPVALSVT